MVGNRNFCCFFGISLLLAGAGMCAAMTPHPALPVPMKFVCATSKPEPWRNLATLDIADDGVTVISSWGIVKPVFQVIGQDAPLPLERLGSVTLIRYERREQAKDVQVRRWEGDTASQYHYVEINRRELNSADFPEGVLLLAPGFYQFKHKSVSGTPPSGFYGKSPVFEIKAGENINIVQITLNPAI